MGKHSPTRSTPSRPRARRFAVPLAGVLALTGMLVTAPTASAAVTASVSAPTLTSSRLTWSCDVNPNGAAIGVTGASWANGSTPSYVETAKTQITGSTTHRLTFSRTVQAGTTYAFRCKWYSTGGTLLGKTSYRTAAVPSATTAPQTKFGAITETLNDPNGSTAANWESIYTEHRTALGAPLGVRVFSSGAVPLATDASQQGQFMTWIAAHHPDEEITVSFKQYDATRLGSLMTWAQSHGIRLTIVYFHEPQDDCGRGVAAACGPTYKAIYQKMRTAIDAHPWHANVQLDKVLMWYYQRYSAASHPGTDWTNYVEPAVNGVKQDPADAVTWDAYQESWITTYDSPAAFMQYPLAVWNKARMPWGYGELGSHVLSGDSTRTGWVNAIKSWGDAAQTPSLAGSAYAALPPAVSVKWWCVRGDSVTDPPFHLEQDARAESYWGGLMQAHAL